MNGSKSPVSATRAVDPGDNATDENENAVAKLTTTTTTTINGHRSPSVPADVSEKASTAPSVGEGENGSGDLPDAPVAEDEEEEGKEEGEEEEGEESGARIGGGHAGEEDAASEAETLISSPVKKKEAERQSTVIKTEKPQKSRIGALSVPHDDDEDAESTASPMPSTEVSMGKTTSIGGDAKDEDADAEMVDDDGSDKDNGSDSLSSARLSASEPPSRASSRDRAVSENAELARNGATESPNPRKRKHRASSAELPNRKRQSMDPPKRRLRGMHSEDIPAGRTERSQSPQQRGHRRTFSTQSALDGTAEASSRTRRGSHIPLREPKSAKTGWEESDASSETTSRGQPDENKRPQRGVGRSTSTPGRPIPREHKRHVNKYGFTRLAEACEDGNLELVKEWREKDPDQLEVAEFASNKPLQIAALNGNAEVVSYLIDQGCQIDCANVDMDTPLIDAAENGHLEVVQLLLDAGVDPLRQNLKGQQALDVVTDETDEATEIRAALHRAIDRWNSSEAKQRREEEEEQRHRAGPSKELHFMARTYENLLRLVQINDRNGVREFLAARVPVDHNVIAAAARTGDLYLVNMLLAEMTEKKAHQKAEKPMLAVLGTSHFEMVKSLTELDQFNPVWRSRAGKSWWELAEELAGPNWRAERELLLRLFEEAGKGVGKERRSSSPVGKRDGSGKRRSYLQQQHRAQQRRWEESHREGKEGEEEDEEVATAVPQKKRKNGRRLMSRKDMRAAGGGKGALTDSSEDDAAESTSDTAAHSAPGAEEEGEEEENEMEVDVDVEKDEGAMKPPDSPQTRRQAGRLRSKSVSSEQKEASPKLRRRSSSLRGAGDERVLPTVEEKVEDERLREEREAEAKFVLEQVQELERKRLEAEEAEAEALRIEAEVKRVEEERAREEERRMEEERRVEEERVRRLEEERRVEEMRKAEEERLRRERELEEARKAHKRDVLASLPESLSYVLDPESSFAFESDAERSFLLRTFTPLLVVRVSSPPLPSGQGEDHWILNLQAAALIGKLERKDVDRHGGRGGLELFFKRDSPGFEGSLAERWRTEELNEREHGVVDQILADLPVHARIQAACGNGDVDGDIDMRESEDEEEDFHSELRKAAERWNSFVHLKRKVRQGAALLRLVRLEDVRQRLHPLLRGRRIAVEFASSVYNTGFNTKTSTDSSSAVSLGKQFRGGSVDVMKRLQAVVEQRRRPPTTVSDSLPLEPWGPLSSGGGGVVECVRKTDVVVVHEK